jgi:hypothetical protein
LPGKTRAQAKQAVFDYIAVFYKRKRWHWSIGYWSLAAFEENQKVA